jgi:hypothetical protein
MASISSCERYISAKKPPADVSFTESTNNFFAVGDGPFTRIHIVPYANRSNKRSAVARHTNMRPTIVLDTKSTP